MRKSFNPPSEMGVANLEWSYLEMCNIATTANEDEVITWFGKDGFPSEINVMDINKTPIKYFRNK